jgi:hypothetical protein
MPPFEKLTEMCFSKTTDGAALLKFQRCRSLFFFWPSWIAIIRSDLYSFKGMFEPLTASLYAITVA